MVKQVQVEGLKELLTQLDEQNTKDDVFILFTGSHDTSGKSWCPDCNEAAPIVKEALKSAPEDSTFITCIVGERAVWKNPENEFRKHPEFKLTCVPTLLKWKTAKRLGDSECKKADLVEMLLED